MPPTITILSKTFLFIFLHLASMTIIHFCLERTFGLHKDMSILIYWLVGSFIFPQLPSSILLMISAKASLKNDSQGVMPKNNKKWFWEPILIINNNTGQAVKPWLGLASAFIYIQYITAQPKLLFLPLLFHGYAKLSLIFKTLFLHVYSWSFLSLLFPNFFCFWFHFTSLSLL